MSEFVADELDEKPKDAKPVLPNSCEFSSPDICERDASSAERSALLSCDRRLMGVKGQRAVGEGMKGFDVRSFNVGSLESMVYSRSLLERTSREEFGAFYAIMEVRRASSRL